MSAANLLPGPSSTEVALGIGRERAGLRGMLLAGVAFISPAAMMVLAIAMVYQRLGDFAATEWALSGIQAVVIVVIIRAALALAPTALPAPPTWLICGGACILGLMSVHPVLILGAAALAMLLGRRLAGMPVTRWRWSCRCRCKVSGWSHGGVGGHGRDHRLWCPCSWSSSASAP